MALKVLLACGIVASVVRFAGDRVAGRLLLGYSFAAQSISELSAAGAPTRALVVAVEVAWSLLMLAFAAGVWRTDAGNTALRVTAALLAGNALVTLVVAAFLPARFGEAGATNTSTANVIVMAVGVVLYLAAIAFGAAAIHGWFRVVSIGILVAYVVLTVVGLLVHRDPTAPGQTAATVGVQERTMMYSYLLWVAALSAALLAANASVAARNAGA